MLRVDYLQEAVITGNYCLELIYLIRDVLKETCRKGLLLHQKKIPSCCVEMAAGSSRALGLASIISKYKVSNC